MGILNKKQNKIGNNIKIENYNQFLKFLVQEEFSKKIDKYIENDEYQKAINFVENKINYELEVPLISEIFSHNSLNELIINEKSKFINFFVYLKNELLECKEFYFIVSFIKFSGIQLLINTLDELEKKGIKGKIITSVYLNITDEKALRKLLTYRNIEVKIYNNFSESFHTKAYLFKKDNYSTCIIGSSNISQSALYSGEEWNIKLTDSSFFPIYKKSISQFNKLWNSNESIKLSEDFIEKYAKYKENNKEIINVFNYKKIQENNQDFTPNTMQIKILKNLEIIRKQNKNKAVVIAATGTGKTYLVAFDIKNISKKLKKIPNILFLAHREELLENSISVFQKILKCDEYNFGRLYAGYKDYDKKLIFASVQTLRKIYDKIPKNYFDYIIIDEFHHASANSYVKIINYFKNYFLLGLTATPERMDGQNILKLCDYNIVGEIGLKKALEEELIVPFHYFGVNDNTINYDKILYKNGSYNVEQLTNDLNISIRVDYIIEQINRFGYDGDKLLCIAFCQNILHAEYMSREFNSRGFKSKEITSKTNMTERSKIIENFKNNEIEILCVVDIFNEGIDIPNINMLLFLRPTMSSTIFIQQLGRGLRKYKNKNFVTVIDFIGNHKKDYLITKIFSDELNDKNLIFNKKYKIISEIKNQFPSIPGASYIELDRICQERIISKIEKINFNSKVLIKDIYLEHKINVGKTENEILYISDFNSNILLLKEIINKMGSFYNAQIIFEKNEIINKNYINKDENEFLAYFEKKLPLSEPFTYLILKILLKSKIEPQNFENRVAEEYKKYFFVHNKFEHNFLIKRIIKEMIEDEIIENSNIGYRIHEKYINIFNVDNKSEFIMRINEVIKLGLNEFKNNNLYEFNKNILIKYKEYSRVELQILLDSQVPKGTWRSGYANTDRDICLFITNDKEHIIQKHLKYENTLYSENLIQWISQPKTYHESSVGQMYINHKKLNYNVHIFVRKFPFNDNNKTNLFTYLGKADYHTSSGDKPMKILWKLRDKIPNSIIDKLFIK